jgi:hypothetical protein
VHFHGGDIQKLLVDHWWKSIFWASDIEILQRLYLDRRSQAQQLLVGYFDAFHIIKVWFLL